MWGCRFAHAVSPAKQIWGGRFAHAAALAKQIVGAFDGAVDAGSAIAAPSSRSLQIIKLPLTVQ
jgi:hypothetical protein